MLNFYVLLFCPSNIYHAFLMPYSSWFNHILIIQHWNNAPLLFFLAQASLSLLSFALIDNTENTWYLFIFIYVPNCNKYFINILFIPQISVISNRDEKRGRVKIQMQICLAPKPIMVLAPGLDCLCIMQLVCY